MLPTAEIEVTNAEVAWAGDLQCVAQAVVGGVFEELGLDVIENRRHSVSQDPS
jgi:hypothetical protein